MSNENQVFDNLFEAFVKDLGQYNATEQVKIKAEMKKAISDITRKYASDSQKMKKIENKIATVNDNINRLANHVNKVVEQNQALRKEIEAIKTRLGM